MFYESLAKKYECHLMNVLRYSNFRFDFVVRLVLFSVLFNSFVNKPFIKLNYGGRICQGFDF